jgi:hypothetical protein
VQPAPRGERTAKPPPAAPPPVKPPPAAPQTEPLPPLDERPGRSYLAPLAIGAAILVAAAAVAGAILLERSDSSAGGETAAPRRANSAAEAGTAGFPPVGRARMAEEIHDLLLGFHEDVVVGDFRPAWALLSPRKRRQDLREPGGYGAWKSAQASLSPYLSPSGLRVRIEALEDEGVARVMLTGMGWSAPHSPCSEWSGLTWVKYQGGKWTYDPGYSTTASRRRTWESRSGELLGIGC